MPPRSGWLVKEKRRRASASAFFTTLVTGVLLTFYYKPYTEVAYQSIKDIHFVVPTGHLIRNIHR